MGNLVSNTVLEIGPISGKLNSIKTGDKLLIKDNRDCQIDDCVSVYPATIQ